MGVPHSCHNMCLAGPLCPEEGAGRLHVGNLARRRRTKPITMRAMRTCTVANAFILGLVAIPLGFAACSTPPSQPPVAPDGPVGVAVTPSGGNAAPAAPPGPAEAAKPPKLAPRTASDCKQTLSDIVNEPDGGVVMNNATPSRDGGASDRVEPIRAVIAGNRDAFRCCFDVWAKQNAGAFGGVKMVLLLTPKGGVKSVTFGETPDRVRAPEVEACMTDLATSLHYPKSPTGMETTFTYPFDFKARR